MADSDSHNLDGLFAVSVIENIQIKLYPVDLDDIQGAICNYLNSKCGHFMTELDGILVTYRLRCISGVGVQINCGWDVIAPVARNCPVVPISVQLAAQVFRPKRGQQFVARVTSISDDSIHCLIGDQFNVTILCNAQFQARNHQIPSIGDTVLVQVTHVKIDQGHLSIFSYLISNNCNNVPNGTSKIRSPSKLNSQRHKKLEICNSYSDEQSFVSPKRHKRHKNGDDHYNVEDSTTSVVNVAEVKTNLSPPPKKKHRHSKHVTDNSETLCSRKIAKKEVESEDNNPDDSVVLVKEHIPKKRKHKSLLKVKEEESD